MSNIRDSFHSRIGFVLAAAGSAIGLGNIWGFPTQAANNGGGAFLFVYLVVTILLALPALYAEVYIGNQAQKNPVSALEDACRDTAPRLGKYAGLIGLGGAIMMLSFYTIVAGWMLAHAISPLAELLGYHDISQWLATSSTLRNLLFTPVFILLGAAIIHQGVNAGIEKWSARLMPVLLIMLVALITYILQQPGAEKGLRTYLIPDFSQVTNPKLIISAMGQAFFSLSIGVGGMMVYGSYMKKDDDIGKLAISITVLDTFIAFMAGLLIIPALYVAEAAGQQVFQGDKLIGEGQLIFNILPELFNSMGNIGMVVAIGFFSLLSIAALTSTISSTEVPVAYLVEDKNLSRSKATWLVSAIVLTASMTIITFFDSLFGMVIRVLTTILQPLSCLFYFIVVGWLWKRGNKLRDVSLQEGRKWLPIWGNYLRFVCPLLLTVVFVNVAILN
ncbi:MULTISPECIES: sodium-dependent transporter [unclassified Colwellia]|uniref:sodium-dependent transporter n=1 Tax=unclassified Colwellia TaxID=196834 RepID=UPI0015F557FA|nr:MULTISPECIES: sodium-dependent transporter [unclassified Colwellia]MBA6224166.1 sodium-dependent transporter [Colwellia sp. MB3u-45]MBA6269196.1 sodium-dependent transporter [Colwellia sp. MB3u-43]MBA6288285.1 sodium-dependent transporter [Colwellia sp. MB3u-4]MBA6322752.1 sodium-dependent transporter [Colwellia sp. MB02u-19]MBA6323498.1 sodium-dependent transporter [Colwellia sp. MB02u-18]